MGLFCDGFLGIILGENRVYIRLICFLFNCQNIEAVTFVNQYRFHAILFSPSKYIHWFLVWLKIAYIGLV